MFPTLKISYVMTLAPHRAQRLLIRAIEDMSFQTKMCEKVKINKCKKNKTIKKQNCQASKILQQLLLISWRLNPLALSRQVWREAQQKEKAVRIVSTGRQGRNPMWVSVEKEKTKSSDSGDL